MCEQIQQKKVLQEITNTITQSTSLKPSLDDVCLLQDQQQLLLSNIIDVSSNHYDFGECMPGTIHQKTLTIIVKQSIKQPIYLYIYISCEDETLNQLPEFIFGVRKQHAYEFYDQLKIKINKKGQYSFMIGAKTPNLYQHSIQSKMYIWMDGYSEEAIIVDLQMTIQLPKISCIKQLLISDYRVIKLSYIHNRSKRQFRIPFRHHHQTALPIEMQIIGLQENTAVIDVKPKSLNLSGKGQFFLTFLISLNQQITSKLQYKSSVCQRRILIIRVKGSTCIFHFPIQLTYYNSASKQMIDTD